MAKFSIEGISSGTGSGVLTIKPNLSNDPNSIHRGILKIYQVTEGEGGTKVKTLKKTINLTQNKKSSSEGGSGGSGGGDTPTSSKTYRIEIYNSPNTYILSSAPEGTRTYTVLLVGNSVAERVNCRCYSVMVDPHTGVMDVSSKTKVNMTIESSDPNLTFYTSKMEDSSVALSDSYFTIKSDINKTRNATAIIYPSDMVGKKDEYSITISLIIRSLG